MWEEGDQTGKYGLPYLGKASASPRTALPIWTFLLVCAASLRVQQNSGMASTDPVSGNFNVCTEDVDAYNDTVAHRGCMNTVTCKTKNSIRVCTEH